MVPAISFKVFTGTIKSMTSITSALPNATWPTLYTTHVPNIIGDTLLTTVFATWYTPEALSLEPSEF